MSAGHRNLTRGLTLLEVVIAVSLIALLLGAMLTFFLQTTRAREAAAQELLRTQVARQVLMRISTELRGCLGVEEIGFPTEQRLVGDRRSITFLTSTLPARHQYEFRGDFEDAPPAQHDLAQVHYRLWIDTEETTEDGDPMVGGILRQVKKTLNQLIIDEEIPEQLRTDNWAPELGYLEFRYFDGVEWTTVWDVTAGNSLPQMIQVTVGYQNITQAEYEDSDLDEYPIEDYPFGPDEEDVDRYTVLVRMPTADRFFSSRVQRLGQQLNSGDAMGVEGMP